MIDIQTLIQNTNDRLGLQVELEKAAIEDGRDRFMKRTQDARESGNGSDTVAGQITMPLLIPHISKTLGDLLEAAKPKGSAGKTSRWVSVYTKVGNMDLLAAEGLRAVLNAVGHNLRLPKLLITLGRALENNYLAQTLIEQDEKAWTKRITKVRKSNDTAKGRARGLRATANALEADVEDVWSDAECVAMSEPLLNAVLLTGLFERHSETEDAYTLDTITLTDEGWSLFNELDETHQWLQPSKWPMAVPPKPWATFDNGCYHTPAIAKQVTLVRTQNKDHAALVSQALRDGKLKDLTRALDAIGATEFQLNPKVVELVQWVEGYEKGLKNNSKSLGIKKFPRFQKVAIPTRPENFEELDGRAKGRIIGAEKKAKRVNRGVNSNLVGFAQDMGMMKHLLNLGGFYLPHNMDFRGRVYPVTPFNHQRADHIKGVFQFAKGKALGTHGLRWLARGLANAGAFEKVDKKSWDEREAWVAANMELIVSTASSPTTDLRWTKADAPFTFYAFCLEMVAALSSGNPEAFVSHLPIALDGSNSGVQHYSCALKAPEGKYVNLVPQELPADLYAVVWADVAEKCQNIIATTQPLPGAAREVVSLLAQAVKDFKKANPKSKEEAPEAALLERACAELVLSNNGGRSLVKRPVMTYGYGSEAYGFKEQYIMDFMLPLELERICGQREVHPYGDDAGEAVASWLAKRTYEAVVGRLSLVAQGMRFFQACAGTLAHEGKSMLWHTPLGLPVVHQYNEWDLKEVELFLYDQTVKVPELKDKVTASGSVLKRFKTQVATKPTPTIIKSKQKSAVAPNIIHSMDSTHLLKAVLYGLDAGINDFMLIHDSFATHAGSCGNPDVMENTGFFWLIRTSFVDLYEEFDLFEAIHQSTLVSLSPEGRERLDALPDGRVPQKGTLERKAIIDSRYCFS